MNTQTKTLPFELADEVPSFAGLSIIPLFPASEPRLEYVGLDEAAARGLVAQEVSEAGAVEALTVVNPLSENVLLYEGEELAGAKQNRIVVKSVLVHAKTTATIAVNCVEQGRWAYRTPVFEPAPRAAYPELRRAKLHGQHAVWAEVSAKQARLRSFSPTSAAESLYVDHAPRLEEYLAAFPRVEGQSGAVAAVGGRVVCLDWVSRSEVWAGLHAKLVRGYALSALESRGGKPVGPEDVARLVEDGLRSELVADGETIAMTIFPAA